MTETRFAILCYPRTGSNYLCGLLGSHPDILCHHEVFNAESISLAFEHRNSGQLDHLLDVEKRDEDPFGFLDRIWGEGFGERAVGIKLLKGQGELVLPSIIEDRSVKKIVLERENNVQSFVSWERARQTGFFAHTPYDDTRVVIHPDQFLAWAYEHRTWYRELRASLAGQEIMDVTYESVVSGEPVSELLAFLGVDSTCPLQAKNKKQSRSSLREAVANFDYLETFFQGTVFHEQLVLG